MRAILVRGGRGPAESLYIGEIDAPSPRPGEVLINVKAFGLNRMDIHQREGQYPPPPGASQILGVEFSGVISELGNDVEEWKIGDEVIGLVAGGAYAELVTVPQENLIKKPQALTWAEAAAIPENFLTAFQALILIGSLRTKENVLIHAAASGVGVAAIQLARIYGAETVIGTTSTEHKINWILGLPNGATHAVNYKTQNFAAEVNHITKGHGADVVIDFVAQSHFVRNIEALAVDGRMTMLALLSGSIVNSFDLSPILRKRLRIEGSTLRSRAPKYQANLISRFETEVLQQITGEGGTGPIRIYLHQVYPWDRIIDAHREMESNNNLGKIIVTVA
ncbi:quinone oxidoreductase putative [Coprinopsis marcescibilis]|uniref:Quinone oxidoreductase putative n=1 Tax=Coprinopsis marcescibilis TaxID=230819 RepID=A0A5C3KJU6_COPMA|nr:quinone oxidoreductase putative [Coprinopsis marcescibilis]